MITSLAECAKDLCGLEAGDGTYVYIYGEDGHDLLKAYNLPAVNLFGGDGVEKFTAANRLTLIARAHQLVMEGHKPLFNATLVTVWSAPNYCYRCGNVAAILELDDDLGRNFQIFEAAAQELRGVPQKSPVPEYFL